VLADVREEGAWGRLEGWLGATEDWWRWRFEEGGRQGGASDGRRRLRLAVAAGKWRNSAVATKESTREEEYGAVTVRKKVRWR
jgi:hypothetical protein